MSDSQRGPAIFAGPLYFVAALLIVIPLLDFVPNVWPPHLGEVSWRYGTVGLFANYTMTPVLGFVVLAVTAAAMNHELLLRVSGWLLIVMAGLLLVVTLLFVLDAIQIRSSAPPENQILVVVGSGRAVIKNLLVVGGMAWLGIASLRFRPIRRSGER